jgi:type I restriction enzyme S subunit
VPPPHEQAKIVDFLDRETAKIDVLIAKQEQLITTLGERRLTLVSVAVSGLDLRQELNEQSDPNWPQVPKSWDLVALKRVLAIPMTDGPHETPEFFDEGIEFISAESVSSGEIDFAKRRGFISAQEHSRYCLKYKPKMNDIYVVKSGATTGRSAILREERDFNIWSPLAVIRCGRRANPFFMHYAIQSRQFQQAISLSWTFGTQQNIGMSTLQNLKVPVPAFELQSKIVQSLDLKLTSIHRLTSACKRQLGLLTERRQSLISAAVTGKIDLSKGL